MSTPDAKRARTWLEAQIVELGALRNASTRDSGFKQWRQHTLTLIQRIWVGDSTKASRFKRIPFTTPGTKADRDQVRNAYEKGCGEALSCLRQLLDEIDERPPRLASQVEPEGSPPSLDLNRIIEPDVDADVRHGAPKLPISRKPGIRPALGPESFEPSELDLREVRNLPASDRSQHAPEEEIPPPPRRLAQEPPRRQAEEPPRRPAEPPRRQAEEPPRRHTEDVKRRMQETVRGQADTSRRPIGEPPRHPAEQPARRSADEPARRPDEPPKRSDEPGEHEVVRRAMADFLDASPVFAAMDRMEREQGDEPRISPSAFALAALASELADLGVPAPHREFVRDALKELAKHIDHRDLTWDELREAVAVVMEFRGVARRVLPLLVPFLDEAA